MTVTALFINDEWGVLILETKQMDESLIATNIEQRQRHLVHSPLILIPNNSNKRPTILHHKGYNEKYVKTKTNIKGELIAKQTRARWNGMVAKKLRTISLNLQKHLLLLLLLIYQAQ